MLKHLLEGILYSFMKKIVISGSSKLQEELITWNQLVKKSAVEAWGYYEYRYIRHRIKQIIIYFFKRQKI